jgi:hypothetical protein
VPHKGLIYYLLLIYNILNVGILLKGLIRKYSFYIIDLIRTSGIKRGGNNIIKIFFL